MSELLNGTERRMELPCMQMSTKSGCDEQVQTKKAEKAKESQKNQSYWSWRIALKKETKKT